MRVSKRSLWLAFVVAACAGTGSSEQEEGALGNGVTVPLSWQTARGVNGHRVHVLTERVPCASCHAITDREMGVVTPQRCAPCHQKEAALRHAVEVAEERFGEGATADCTSCHAFTLDGTGHGADGGPAGAVVPADCRRCHDKQQGDTPGVQVHGTSECVGCHRPHEDRTPKPGPCESCHEDVSTGHAAKGRSILEACVTCHAHQHAPASEALATCAPCHRATEPKVAETALFAEGHRECVGCHRPHQFEKGAAVACRSCHEAVRVLGAPRVRAHDSCTSCHAAHDVRGSPERACASCHRDVHPDHPTRGVAGTCVGCHDPHPSGKEVHARVRECSVCHQTAASDHDFHAGVACSGCHAPHDFVLTSAERDPCRRCHERQVTLTAGQAGHGACEGCHRGLPHRPARLQAGCETCHAGVKNAAHAGHQDCRNCHEPHGGTVQADCKTCHRDEHRTAPKGHQTCTGCHDEHSGSTRAVQCATCHQESKKTPHGARVAACTSCHRPHGPKGVAKPPACTSCHAPSGLAGLHGTRQHDQCTQCHTGHGQMVDSLKTTCLSCHRDRVRHFPEAPSCTSCHLFVKTK